MHYLALYQNWNKNLAHGNAILSLFSMAKSKIVTQVLKKICLSFRKKCIF